jgi:hypothetical protein
MSGDAANESRMCWPTVEPKALPGVATTPACSISQALKSCAEPKPSR